jgi:putative ABC transport system permease protein
VSAVLRALGAAFSTAILSLVHLAAWLLAPWRMGRLLRTVSLPRFHEHRLRTALTVLGIALGVAVLIAVVLVNRSVMRGFTETLEDVSGRVDLEVTASRGFEEDRLDLVRGVAGVAGATPVVQETAVYRRPDGQTERLVLLGVDFLGEDDERFRTYGSNEMKTIKEDPIAFLNAPTNLVLARSLAERMGLGLKDKLTLTTPSGQTPFEVWGFIDDDGVGRAFGGNVAVMYYQALQVAFDRGTRIDRIDLDVAESASLDAVRAAVLSALGPGFTVERPARRTGHVSQMLSGLRLALTMGSLVALIVGLFLIYNTLSISVVQRRRELGILRALGTTRRQVLALFVLEGALLGFVGSALGALLGLQLARVMLRTVTATVNELYLQVAATEVDVDAGLLLVGFVLGVVGATASAWVPAREATRVSPVETLRTGYAVAPPRRAGLGRLDLYGALSLAIGVGAVYGLPPVDELPIGAFIAAVAIVLAVAFWVPQVIRGVVATLRRCGIERLGVEVRMANDNVPRDLTRASVTSGALMVAVAMSVAFAGFLESFRESALRWVDRTVPADLFITSSNEFSGTQSVPMTDTLGEPLAALEGVEAVERVRLHDFVYAETPVKLLSTEMKVFANRASLTFLEGDVEQGLRGTEAGGVLLSENFARRFDLHVGTSIELSTPRGSLTYPVAGVVVDYTSDVGTLILDRATYVRDWEDARVDTYKLYLTPGTDPEPVRAKVMGAWGEKFDLFVLTNAEFKREIEAILDQSFAVMRALELVALLIAVMGVVNAVLASVLDRVREIGVLRAVGMLRRQVRRMVMVEAGILGLSSAIAGLVAGLGLAWLLIDHIFVAQSAWHIPWALPWGTFARLCVTVVVVAIFAGWYPAREAAALEVGDALEYE